MRRKIRYSKRYKDYPSNVPKKLLKLFFSFDRSVSKLAAHVDLNSGTVSSLLVDGTEPSQKNPEARRKLFLPVHPVCKTCGRKILFRTKQKEKPPQPEFMKQWKHLPTTERQKVIQQYMRYKDEKEKRNPISS